MSNKHLPPDEQPVKREDDLESNPGIGQSKGIFAHEKAEDASLIEGDNTVEGDTENDAGLPGGVSREQGRTNK
ncbi:MAG: hypothetical protein M3N07_02630 [Pseudomonadota bacterium]|nr:hypothetical protein [Pseudomonadota bacterium]